MVTMLRDWAMVLSGVAVFGSLCEVILPDGSFQKYIRLGLGMVLVLTLISPLQELLHHDFDIGNFQSGTYAYLERETMEEEQRKEVMIIYRENLNQKMQQTLITEFPGFSGRVSCSVEEENPEEFGKILRVQVLLEHGTGKAEEIQKILSREYGVLKTQVEVAV
ncbi:MAG: stage III sporulation protein AF [Clostridia bacterium]|nr:stage III sporulation protein AF [Clostridia bacterium]